MNEQILEIKLLVSDLAKFEISHLIDYLVHPIGYKPPVETEYIKNPKTYESQELEQENITFILDRQMLTMGSA
jgi:predicted phosphatase